MKVVIDDKIPYIRGVFERFADICYKAGSDIVSADVRDADVLIVRTRTRCDSRLLSGSSVRMIATATIGFDHIDLEYCSAHGIRVVTAAGCNAGAVMQWVFAGLRELGVERGVLGVVGVGNVGSLVCSEGAGRGFEVLRCDPPRAEREGYEGFVTLDELLSCADVITVHTPLDATTRGMVGDDFFAKAKQGVVFMNSSRGEVVDEAALKDAIARGVVSKAVIDVWNHEPNIDTKLLSMVNIATPHIAGYSARGKARGTEVVVRAVAEEFNLLELLEWSPDVVVQQEIPENYNILSDDKILRDNIANFEELRSNYKYR